MKLYLRFLPIFLLSAWSVSAKTTDLECTDACYDFSKRELNNGEELYFCLGACYSFLQNSICVAEDNLLLFDILSVVFGCRNDGGVINDENSETCLSSELTHRLKVSEKFIFDRSFVKIYNKFIQDINWNYKMLSNVKHIPVLQSKLSDIEHQALNDYLESLIKVLHRNKLEYRSKQLCGTYWHGGVKGCRLSKDIFNTLLKLGLYRDELTLDEETSVPQSGSWWEKLPSLLKSNDL